MTRQFQVYLNPSVSSITYSCVHCRAHLADHNDLISKAFQGSQGRAYLFDKVVNVKSASAEDRLLLTGQHRVADLHCAGCNSLLGWKYERAFEENRWTESCLPSSPSSGYQSGEATSPVGRPSSTTMAAGGLRNEAFTVDSSGDEEAGLLPSTSAQHQRQLLSSASECGGTLRRTIETNATPGVTFEQTSPQLNHAYLRWSDLPLSDDSFLSHSVSTYEIAPTRSSTARRAPVCLFHPTTIAISAAAVPLLAAAPNGETEMEAESVVMIDEVEGVSEEASLHRPTTLLPHTVTPSFSTEAVQVTVTSNSNGPSGLSANTTSAANEAVVFSAAFE
ncbi:Protein yippee-like 3 [Taenia crassiceps]|uniref:Protein yippee-like 3 n=1 Tax=Taenia crassiceps TaxID=6207 RepID=A0ABR4Q671_9CEST